jgi:hypothetical protein
MSFSRGGSSESATTNEQNPITATDNAMVASEGGTITVTDGGAFDTVNKAMDSFTDIVFGSNKVVGDAMLSNETLAAKTIDAGLDFQDKSNNVILETLDNVFNFVGDTVTKSQDTISSSATALFNSAKSDELNKSQDMQQTIRTLAMYAAVGGVAFVTIKYAFK